MNDTAIGTVTYGIAQRLERLPMTSYQRIIFLVIATAWLFDSMDLGMMTFILGSIKSEFGLSAVQAGLLGSASFAGMFLGAATSGMLADRFGRRLVFQWSMVLWGAGSFLCATANDVETLMLFRVLLGIGMGMEFPIGQAMLSEIMPAVISTCPPSAHMSCLFSTSASTAP
jgi:MFS transporter, putative metabolite:H+ symporter